MAQAQQSRPASRNAITLKNVGISNPWSWRRKHSFSSGSSPLETRPAHPPCLAGFRSTRVRHYCCCCCDTYPTSPYPPVMFSPTKWVDEGNVAPLSIFKPKPSMQRYENSWRLFVLARVDDTIVPFPPVGPACQKKAPSRTNTRGSTSITSGFSRGLPPGTSCAVFAVDGHLVLDSKSA